MSSNPTAPRRARGRGALRLALLVAVSSGGCKRSLAPKVEEAWDEAPAVDHAEALATLAPPWREPTRAMLDSGLVTFWLHEPGAPVTHVRVLLPTGDAEPLRAAAVAAVLQAHLEEALRSRAKNRGVSVATRLAPDRIELSAHGAVEETARMLELLAGVLGARAPQAGLDMAKAAVVAALPATASPDERAIAALVEALLERPAGSERADRAAVQALDGEALMAGWQALVDPRRAVLVVHAGAQGSDHRPALRQLAERWRGTGRRPVPPSAIARLRPGPPISAAPVGGRLLAAPATALQVLPGPEGGAVLALGRVLPTPTTKDRSFARLAQRLLQEELDARLVIRGDAAVFVLRAPLSAASAEHSAAAAIDVLAAMAAERQPRQRLYQAAQLWLGARVVQASLDGEDWTALWSDAMDLAERDEEIAAALARDAGSMLEPDPAALQAWLRRWLDPRSGEPGWRWVVAGASARDLQRLTRITPVATPAPRGLP
jgi:hypothetical protein